MYEADGTTTTRPPSSPWSISGADAELLDRTNIAETTLKVPHSSILDRKSIEELRFRLARYFSFVKVGFIKVGEPEASDVEISETELFYIPVWRVVGSYACRYVRKATYTTTLSSDVEEVRINGEAQQIATDRKKVSDVVSDIASSSAIPSGLGPIPLTPFQGAIRSGMQRGLSSGMKVMLRSKDKEVSHKVQLTIAAEEIASYALKAELCYNAHLGVEDKKMLKGLQNVARFVSGDDEDTKKKSLGIRFTKEDVISELKKSLIKAPEVKPRRILEQVIVASRFELIYVPCYRFVARSRGHEKVIELNTVTGEDRVPKIGF